MITSSKKNNFQLVADISQGSDNDIIIFLEQLIITLQEIDNPLTVFLGNRRHVIESCELLIELSSKLNASLSQQIPNFQFPHSKLDQEIEKYSFPSTGQKYKWFKRNLLLFQAIQEFDCFYYLSSDLVQEGFNTEKYLEIFEKDNDNPVQGDFQYLETKNGNITCGWHAQSYYNGEELRAYKLENYFHNRIPNPWLELSKENSESNFLQGITQHELSAFDLPLNYLIYINFHRNITGSNNPEDWNDKHSKYRRVIKTVDINNKITNSFWITEDKKQKDVGKRECYVNENLSHIPVGMPDNSPLKSLNERFWLKDAENLFKGNRCFLIGNGPSLIDTDLKKLNKEYTVGLNRIYLNYEKMGFEPTFLCVANQSVIEQFHKEIDPLRSIKFLRYQTRNLFERKYNTFFMEHLGSDRFSKKISQYKWNEGSTVTYCAMQVLYYLGFDEVILVGVDHHFSKSGKPHKLIIQSDYDVNHFHPDYFGKGIKWQYPDLAASEASYKVAKNVFENDGRSIYDATLDGMLNLFSKVNYESLFTTE